MNEKRYDDMTNEEWEELIRGDMEEYFEEETTKQDMLEEKFRNNQ